MILTIIFINTFQTEGYCISSVYILTQLTKTCLKNFKILTVIPDEKDKVGLVVTSAISDPIK